MATVVQNEWLLRVLGVQTSVSGAEPGSPPADTAAQLRDWQAARAAWQDASQSVDSQISALQAALRREDDPEMVEIAEFGLAAITQNSKVPLMAALMEAGDGNADSLAKASPKLRAAIKRMRGQIESNPMVDAFDDNPLGVPVTIGRTLGDALDTLEDALPA